jgi:hypothetical protein
LRRHAHSRTEHILIIGGSAERHRHPSDPHVTSLAAGDQESLKRAALGHQDFIKN